MNAAKYKRELETDTDMIITDTEWRVSIGVSHYPGGWGLANTGGELPRSTQLFASPELVMAGYKAKKIAEAEERRAQHPSQKRAVAYCYYCGQGIYKSPAPTDFFGETVCQQCGG